MKKMILTASLVSGLMLSSGAALADNQCDVNIDGQLSLIDNVLTITTEDKDKIVIQPDYTMYINGKTANLSYEQQRWVEQYYEGIHNAVPVVAELAIDGIEIATVAMEEVFGNLLGTDADVLDDITLKLQDLKQDIKYNFYAEDGSIRLDSERFEDGEVFGSKWEAEFEEAIEEVVSASIGRIMVAVGTQLMFGDGDMDDFERRMENFGEQIEQKVETQTANLEERADALCVQIANLDEVENKLQANVEGLEDLNMISFSEQHKAM